LNLFLLFSVPLTYFIINALFNNVGIKIRVVILPFILGMAISFPYLLLYWAFFRTFFNTWTSSSLYFFYFFNKDGFAGFYISLVIGLYFYFFKKDNKVSRLREFTAYVSGLFFTIALYDFLVSANWYGGLEVFVLPIFRIATVLLISMFLSRALNNFGWQKYFWFGMALLVPILFPFIPVMYVLNLKLLSISLSVLLFLFSSIIYYLEVRGKFRLF
jgi:hypothetical protein